MHGDKLIIGPHHRRAADALAQHVVPLLHPCETALVVSVAGESGSGKSELAEALASVVRERGIEPLILQQDDYFVYPPFANTRQRESDMSWVGISEVRLDRLDEDLKAILDGADSLLKPLVHYSEDRISEEKVPTREVRLVIVEGTYVSLLRNVHLRVFIDRTYRQTRAARRLRAREKQNPFLEGVLEIEHGIISQHLGRCDLVVTEDYRVVKSCSRRAVPLGDPSQSSSDQSGRWCHSKEIRCQPEQTAT